jgi:hypothetical protein
VSIGNLAVSGKRPLVILADQTITVTGVVRVLAGTRYRYSSSAYGSSGGLGGSFGTKGAGASAETYGTEALEPLVGGMSGQEVCADGACTSPALGGRGGGALQLSAGVNLTVQAGARVDAGGNGGSAPPSDRGGPGGGSGGALVLEAPTLALFGAVVANGGSGAGGASEAAPGHDGAPGSSGTSRSAGGEGEDDHGCFLSGYTVGGDGGFGAALDGPATSGQAGECRSCIPNACVRTGGGGGGLGRVRLRHGGSFASTSVISPAATTALLTPL